MLAKAAALIAAGSSQGSSALRPATKPPLGRAPVPAPNLHRTAH